MGANPPRLDEAKKPWRKAIEMDSSKPGPFFQLARCYNMSNQSKEAALLFGGALQAGSA